MSSFGGRFQAGNRLKRPEEFKLVFSSKQQRSKDRTFLFITRDNGIDQARLGLAVPKKHISKAVDRNRLKRIIREGFRTRKRQLAGKDIVVVVKSSLDINTKTVGSSLIKHWEKICK